MAVGRRQCGDKNVLWMVLPFRSSPECPARRRIPQVGLGCWNEVENRFFFCPLRTTTARRDGGSSGLAVESGAFYELSTCFVFG